MGFCTSLILSELHRSVFVGDVVMLKDPQNPERELVRRVAALEGEEMESSDPDDQPFRLDRGTCWVLCDNEHLSPKVPVWIYFCHLVHCLTARASLSALFVRILGV